MRVTSITTEQRLAFSVIVGCLTLCAVCSVADFATKLRVIVVEFATVTQQSVIDRYLTDLTDLLHRAYKRLFDMGLKSGRIANVSTP